MDASSNVSVVLTVEQLAKLDDVLSDYTDEGPMHEGWASDELQELRDIVGKALRDAGR